MSAHLGAERTLRSWTLAALVLGFVLSSVPSEAAPRDPREALEQRGHRVRFLAEVPGTGLCRRVWLATPGDEVGPSRGKAARDPEMTARQFLSENADLLGLDESLESLGRARVQSSLGGRHVRFRQKVGGLRTAGVGVAVHLDANGDVQLVDNGFQKVSYSVPEPGSWGPDRALERARERVGWTGELRGEPSFEHLYVVESGTAVPVWRVLVPASTPLGDWQVDVRCTDGAVISVENRLRFVEGTGRVFDPNPVVTSRNTLLRDQSDAASAVPDSAYSTVTLLGLEGTGLLRGPHVDVFSQRTDSSGTPAGNLTRANEPTHSFIYDRSDPRFEEVMVYHHIDRFQRYLQGTLGFTGVGFKPITVNAHGLDADQSFFSPATKSLNFGDGGVDDAEDADIIIHEYGHSIQEALVPGYGGSHEARAMGEGFSDFMAVAYFHARGQTFNVPVVGDWDATFYSSAVPPALRRVDGTKTYPGDLLGSSVHADGEIWSGALNDIRRAIGSEAALKIAIEAHTLQSASVSMRDAAQTLVIADENLNGGSHRTAIQSALVQRGLLEDTGGPLVSSFSPRSGQNRVSTALVVRGSGFTGATQVRLSDSSRTVLAGLEVVSDTEIRGTVPAGLASGSYSVEVTVGGQVGTSALLFHVDDHPSESSELGEQDVLPVNTTVSGVIGAPDDRDLFSFRALSGGSYTLDTALQGVNDTELFVLDSDGATVLTSNDDANHPFDLSSRIEGFVAPRSGTFFVAVEGFSSVDTGGYSLSLTGPPPAPDIVVRSITVPTQVTNGQSFSLSATVANEGEATSPGFETLFYLMPGDTFDPSTARLLGSAQAPSLAGGGNSTITLTGITLPRLLLPRSYRVLAVADSTGTVTEADETNNSRLADADLVWPPPADQTSATVVILPGSNLISVPVQVFTSTGLSFTPRDLLERVGGSYLARLTRPAGASRTRWQVFTAGGDPPPPEGFSLSGNEGYLVHGRSRSEVEFTGVPWPESQTVRALDPGWSILAYPAGVPASEGVTELLERADSGVSVETTARNGKSVFSTYLVNSGKAPFPLRMGRGYLVHRRAGGTVTLPSSP